jgi:hypothetical protein
MELRGNWNYPTTVRFGAGRISELGEAVKAAGCATRCSSPIRSSRKCR